MNIITVRDFYKTSGNDFRIDAKTDLPEEISFYQEYAQSDIDANGITYDEYLSYLAKTSPKLEISPVSIETAKNYINFRDCTFYDSGKPEMATLLKKSDFQGISCRADIWVWLYENDLLCGGTLAQDTIIQEKKFFAGTQIYLDDTGKLKKVVLSKDTELAGKIYKAYYIIEFDENGKITDNYLAL